MPRLPRSVCPTSWNPRVVPGTDGEPTVVTGVGAAPAGAQGRSRTVARSNAVRLMPGCSPPRPELLLQALDLVAHPAPAEALEPQRDGGEAAVAEDRKSVV